MADEMQIFRSDDVAALIREYADQSWEAAGDVVMEVLEETLDPQQAAAMTPRDWVRLGFHQGAGHLILALGGGEVRLEVIKGQEKRRPQGRLGKG